MFEDVVEKGLPKKWIIAGVVSVILIIIAFNAFSVVGPTERGVKVTLGVASEEVLSPGLKVVIPFAQKIRKYDLTPIQYPDIKATIKKGCQGNCGDKYREENEQLKKDLFEAI